MAHLRHYLFLVICILPKMIWLCTPEKDMVLCSRKYDYILQKIYSWIPKMPIKHFLDFICIFQWLQGSLASAQRLKHRLSRYFFQKIFCPTHFSFFPQHHIEGLLFFWPWSCFSSLLDSLYFDTLGKTATVVFVFFTWRPL